MDKEKVEKYLDKALKEPYHCVSFVEEGFGFLLHHDKKYFRCTMMFNPSWGHTNGCSGATKDEFLEHMQELIADAKKIFKNGGKFPNDYFKYCD